MGEAQWESLGSEGVCRQISDVHSPTIETQCTLCVLIQSKLLADLCLYKLINTVVPQVSYLQSRDEVAPGVG